MLVCSIFTDYDSLNIVSIYLRVLVINFVCLVPVLNVYRMSADLLESQLYWYCTLFAHCLQIGLLSDINLANHPGLINLLEDGETPEDLKKLSPEQILIRWVNYHLRNAGVDRRIRNFQEDIKVRTKPSHTAVDMREE